MPRSSLQSVKRISSDIFPSIYDWFFIDGAFVRWRKARVIWPLYCIGSPGAGKTTLFSLIYRYLKRHPETQNYPIADICIDREVPPHDVYFIEDFLETLYHKLSDTTVLKEDHSDDAYEEYAEMRFLLKDAPEGYRAKTRLQSLREALNSRLNALKGERAFLLLDGIDRCSPTQRLLLDNELSKLLEAGLSILITSRLAVLERVEALCEHPDDPVPQYARLSLNMYYECCICEYIVCVPCKDAKRSCPNGHEELHLHETYDHVNINIAVPDMAMKEFIAWNLEREHGDLGLGSSARKPPLSPLGRSLISNTASKSVQKHAEDVYEAAGGHIGMAKARLDLIHTMDSLEGIESRRDQLPANIITMFDAGLKRIEIQPSDQRDIALKAIAAAAADIRGVEVPVLREMLRNADIRSGEDVLECSKGFLLTSTHDTPSLRLTAFHQSFFRYISERYNQEIHRASMQINPARPRFAPREIGSPADITPQKLARSITQPVHPFIPRKDTRNWT
ncbi:hypothetical protein BDW02DRAFT_518807 [Decorospora gaudefroyi]|uniref:Nephrocystin 3-like N-terminal domain-containing protein n=1 Tax=Decorospora gaudefroyi TaxID=184978 RepID=A0A6A5KNL8_9PLEO|nr:hypothetical protein BDW02DRAFT_518807 [Decorospora gaudefroyi]